MNRKAQHTSTFGTDGNKSEKFATRGKRRIELHRETLRRLDSAELRRAAGGETTTSYTCVHC